MMNTKVNNAVRTCIAIVPSHLASLVARVLEANYSINDVYVDVRGESGHIFATLSRVVRGDGVLVAAQKHSMTIFVLGVVAGIKATV